MGSTLFGLPVVMEDGSDPPGGDDWWDVLPEQQNEDFLYDFCAGKAPRKEIVRRYMEKKIGALAEKRPEDLLARLELLVSEMAATSPSHARMCKLRYLEGAIGTQIVRAETGEELMPYLRSEREEIREAAFRALGDVQ